MSSNQPPDGRTVVDAASRVWRVYLVTEGRGWDADLPDRRADWLSCVSLAERRFIAPVPDDWLTWSDEELLVAIARARPDLRQSSS